MNDPGPGDRHDLDRAFQGLYEEMYRIATRQFGRERPGHTLQPTAVVNEAYLKLAGQANLPEGRRSEILGIAAHAMRQVLIDHARRHSAEKRGGGRRRTTLGDPGFEVNLDDILAIDAALDRRPWLHATSLPDLGRFAEDPRYVGALGTVVPPTPYP